MKLISAAEYDQLVKKHLPITGQEASFHGTNEKASKILDDSAIPDDIKLCLYSSLVKDINQKLVELTERPQLVKVVNADLPKAESTGPVTSNNESTEDIDINLTSLLPKTYIEPSLYIMSLLRRHQYDITWSNSGEVSFNSVQCPGSNIIDLLNYVLRPKIKCPNGPPIGAKRFLYALRRCSIPTIALGIHLRQTFVETTTETLKKRRTMGSVKHTPDIETPNRENEDQADNEFATPTALSKPRWMSFTRRVS